MHLCTGDDRQWQQGGYGVFGSATPRTAPSQDGPVDVDSIGVWGVLGTPEDLSNVVDELTSMHPSAA
jgi:hypothetical protein